MAFRDMYDSLLKHLCDVYRTNNTVSPTGEQIRGWAILKQNVVCLIQANSKQLITVTEGLKTPINYLLFIKYDEDVKEGDKIIWDTKEYLVLQAPPQDGSGLNHHRECKLEQI